MGNAHLSECAPCRLSEWEGGFLTSPCRPSVTITMAFKRIRIGLLNTQKKHSFQAMLFVGVTGFEPATTWSQTRCATGLRYAPIARVFPLSECKVNTFFRTMQEKSKKNEKNNFNATICGTRNLRVRQWGTRNLRVRQKSDFPRWEIRFFVAVHAILSPCLFWYRSLWLRFHNKTTFFSVN